MHTLQEQSPANVAMDSPFRPSHVGTLSSGCGPLDDAKLMRCDEGLTLTSATGGTVSGTAIEWMSLEIMWPRLIGAGAKGPKPSAETWKMQVLPRLRLILGGAGR